MNKKFGVFFALLFLVVLVSGFVSAQTDSALKPVVDLISGMIKEVFKALEPLLKIVLGESQAVGGYSAEQIFYGKLLIFILVWAAIASVVSFIPFLEGEGKSFYRNVIAIAVSLLGVRFFSSDMVLLGAFPSGVLAVFVTGIIPFLILFFWIEKGMISAMIRKGAWIFALCIFLGLGFLRYSDLGNLSFIYVGTAGLCLLMFLFDHTIQAAIMKTNTNNARYTRDYALLNEYEKRLARNQELLADAISNSNKTAESHLKKQIKANEELIKKVNDRLAKY